MSSITWSVFQFESNKSQIHDDPKMMLILWAIFIILIVHLIYYLAFVVKKPKLYGSKSKLYNFLTENCPAIHQQYWPSPWCMHSLPMSLVPNLIRDFLNPDLNYHRYVFGF